MSLWLYGLNALRIYTLCVAVFAFFELVAWKIVPAKDSPFNWNSITFALLFAMLLPYNISWWIIVVGGFIIIIIGKKLFGGLGAYPVHPVLLGFAMLQVSWPSRLDYTAAATSLNWPVKMIEPMRLVKTLGSEAESLYHIQDLLLGKQVAGIGNAMVIFLFLGGILLLISRQITWHIPAGFILGTFLTGWIVHLINPVQFASPLFQLLTGSTIFAAFFLATDHTTSPVNRIPMLIYGFLGGLLLVLVRSFSVYYDGIAFVILLINLFNPLIDRITLRVIGLEEREYA